MTRQQNLTVYILSIYLFLLSVGGWIGYFQAHSLASLWMGNLSALWLGGCLMMMNRQKTKMSWLFAMLLCVFLSLFFSYRFFLNFKWMPSGLMMLISWSVSSYLFFKRRSIQVPQ